MTSTFNRLFDISKTSFLITGGAGFIGSNLAEFLLENNALKVRVLDNLSTGYLSNIEGLMNNSRFEFIEGDIASFDDCLNATKGMDVVLHQAALGSVPRSIADPLASNNANINGFLNMLHAAVKNNIKRFVYASSSSVYGTDKTMPKKEEVTGELLSPYAVTKKANELYASVFYKTYGLEVIGLRYFNVFGPRQNASGPYSAVIPLFIKALLKGESPIIFGDGRTTRDFTYVENVVQANLLAATTHEKEAFGNVFNIAYGATTSLNDLFTLIVKELNINVSPKYSDERKGDIKNSFADITKAKVLLGFEPLVSLEEGISRSLYWYKVNENSTI